MSHRVLHVSESFGGGVLAAIRDYARATPEVEHHLLYSTHLDAPIDRGVLRDFKTASKMPTGHMSAVKAVRRRRKELRPQVVHAHSSFAGAYVRLALRASTSRGPEPRIVYTPHCFAFERLDIGGAGRAVYRLLEWLLARNTHAFAACSPREAFLARSLNRRSQVVFVPNVAPMPRHPISLPSFSEVRQFNIVGGGRIRGGHLSQKDPYFFAQAIEAAKEHGYSLRAKWIGGGDRAVAEALEAAGVFVTGWVTRERAIEHLADADIYFHTAAWEGFPVSILEADALGIPQVIRSIPAFQGIPLPNMITHPRQLPAVLKGLTSERSRFENVKRIRDALSSNSGEDQANALREVWNFTERTRPNDV